MAKRQKAAPLDPEVLDLRRRTALKIFERISAMDEVWEADGIHMLPHKQLDGQHKQRTLDTALQYILTNVSIGARGQFIFTFEPPDKRDFQSVDANEDQIDKVFPLIAGKYGELIGVDSESMKFLIETSVSRLLDDEKRAEEEKNAQREAEVSEGYAAHPLFGRF